MRRHPQIRSNLRPRHPQILHGDCRALLLQQPLGAFSLCIADPPYALAVAPRKYTSFGNPEVTQSFQFDRDISEGNSTAAEVEKAYFDFSLSWICPLYNCLTDTSNVFVFTTYDRDHIIKAALKKAGFHFKRTLVWFKTNPIPRVTKKEFIYSHEFICWATKTDAWQFHWQDNFQDNHSVFTGPLPGNSERMKKGFPQKPEWLIRKLVTVTTREEDAVIDPFAGSGTTLKVCTDLGRRCVTIEKDPAMISLINQRMLL